MPSENDLPKMPYRHAEYPSWRFSANGEARLVNSPEDEPGEGWADSPAAFDASKDKKTGKK